MQIGLLFPGQGSQHVGMGKDLYEAFPLARKAYEAADRILGFSISELSFNGPEESLRETRNTQPAIFVHSVAAFRVLSERGLMPVIAAGHSLGEYSALTSAGALGFEEAVALVQKRGAFMHEAGLKRPGTMAAILGLSLEKVEAVCSEISSSGTVRPANVNSPSQIVISGEISAVEAAMKLACERGALKAVRLHVGGAFHSPLMESASLALSDVLGRTSVTAPLFPVVANYSAMPVTEPEGIRESLARQVLSAVRWEESMRHMLSRGIKHFVEVGPGNVLKGLMRSIDRSATVLNAATPQEIENVAFFLSKDNASGG